MEKHWAKYGVMLLMLGCGDSEATRKAEPDASFHPDASIHPDASMPPCEERSFEECEDNERCYAVRATKLDLRGDVLCRLGEQVRSCRTRGSDCWDDDAIGLACDAQGGYWMTPQLCIPAGTTFCEGPEGHDWSFPLCSECDLRSPPLVSMRTSGDTQEGAHGSYCISSREGCALCADGVATVTDFLTVETGAQLAFDTGEAKLMAGKCTPACPPSLLIHPAGGDPFSSQAHLLSAEQTWTVDLEPGKYEVWLDSHYEDSKSEGQIYVGFGLQVEATSAP